MISTEEYIADLLKLTLTLQEQLNQAQKDIQDFEKLAVEWKKGHQELKFKQEVKLREKDQIIQELEDEIEDLKANLRDQKLE